MEGPTPISAPIHAATMVAAGIFLIARIFNFISVLPTTMYATSWVGGVTTLSGATLALAQRDLKRGLAYSTMSQLGYMVPASGIGASRSALFHLITHAYSKALSSSGSGSVIHSMEKVVGYSPTRSQNMFLMGGLRKHMPITGTTFLLGTLSLCGIPPLSCFWSKDQIITESWMRSPYLGLTASITAGLTAFYTSRIYLLTSEGNFRANQINYIGFDTSFPSEFTITSWGGTQPKSLTEQTQNNLIPVADVERNEVKEVKNFVTAHTPGEDPVWEEAIKTRSERNLLHPQESNFCMVLPLIILAIPTVFAGLAGVDPTQKGAGTDPLFDWLISLPSLPEINKHFENLTEILISSTPSLILSIIGLSISFKVYGQGDKLVDTKIFGKFESKNLLNTFLLPTINWSTNRGYIDYYHDIYFTRGIVAISKLVLHFDQWIIDGFINGTGTSNLFSGESMRHGKNGRISHYLFGLIIGTTSSIIDVLQLVVDFPIPPLP